MSSANDQSEVELADVVRAKLDLFQE